MVNLGDKCKDKVTGFEGVAVARTEWLYNCTRITVQPPVGKDGKHPDNATFDEPSLIVTKAGHIKIAAMVLAREQKTGGSQDDKAALRRN